MKNRVLAKHIGKAKAFVSSRTTKAKSPTVATSTSNPLPPATTASNFIDTASATATATSTTTTTAIATTVSTTQVIVTSTSVTSTATVDIATMAATGVRTSDDNSATPATSVDVAPVAVVTTPPVRASRLTSFVSGLRKLFRSKNPIDIPRPAPAAVTGSSVATISAESLVSIAPENLYDCACFSAPGPSTTRCIHMNDTTRKIPATTAVQLAGDNYVVDPHHKRVGIPRRHLRRRLKTIVRFAGISSGNTSGGSSTSAPLRFMTGTLPTDPATKRVVTPGCTCSTRCPTHHVYNPRNSPRFASSAPALLGSAPAPLGSAPLGPAPLPAGSRVRFVVPEVPSRASWTPTSTATSSSSTNAIACGSAALDQVPFQSAISRTPAPLRLRSILRSPTMVGSLGTLSTASSDTLQVPDSPSPSGQAPATTAPVVQFAGSPFMSSPRSQMMAPNSLTLTSALLSGIPDWVPDSPSPATGPGRVLAPATPPPREVRDTPLAPATSSSARPPVFSPGSTPLSAYRFGRESTWSPGTAVPSVYSDDVSESMAFTFDASTSMVDASPPRILEERPPAPSSTATTLVGSSTTLVGNVIGSPTPPTPSSSSSLSGPPSPASGPPPVPWLPRDDTFGATPAESSDGPVPEPEVTVPVAFDDLALVPRPRRRGFAGQHDGSSSSPVAPAFGVSPPSGSPPTTAGYAPVGELAPAIPGPSQFYRYRTATGESELRYPGVTREEMECMRKHNPCFTDIPRRFTGRRNPAPYLVNRPIRSPQPSSTDRATVQVSPVSAALAQVSQYTGGISLEDLDLPTAPVTDDSAVEYIPPPPAPMIPFPPTTEDDRRRSFADQQRSADDTTYLPGHRRLSLVDRHCLGSTPSRSAQVTPPATQLSGSSAASQGSNVADCGGAHGESSGSGLLGTGSGPCFLGSSASGSTARPQSPVTTEAVMDWDLRQRSNRRLQHISETPSDHGPNAVSGKGTSSSDQVDGHYIGLSRTSSGHPLHDNAPSPSTLSTFEGEGVQWIRLGFPTSTKLGSDMPPLDRLSYPAELSFSDTQPLVYRYELAVAKWELLRRLQKGIEARIKAEMTRVKGSPLPHDIREPLNLHVEEFWSMFSLRLLSDLTVSEGQVDEFAGKLVASVGDKVRAKALRTGKALGKKLAAKSLVLDSASAFTRSDGSFAKFAVPGVPVDVFFHQKTVTAMFRGNSILAKFDSIDKLWVPVKAPLRQRLISGIDRRCHAVKDKVLRRGHRDTDNG